MTIAVLDTGIDPNHPDVADKIVASQNFVTIEGSVTDEDFIVDGHGHGTHVASIAAGSGAASDGLRKGVAPGADLAIGRVMDANGDGYTSDIIAGMEWAAELDGVDVINMSLGGAVSDGTDPMSLALNELTAENGVLFVTSAGNDGPKSGTVSYPATADAALAVGAVDKNGELASFSSRGPRMGDYAITPQITAPGVGIRAARAAGTSMGNSGPGRGQPPDPLGLPHHQAGRHPEPAHLRVRRLQPWRRRALRWYRRLQLLRLGRVPALPGR